jgi:cytochrome c1
VRTAGYLLVSMVFGACSPARGGEPHGDTARPRGVTAPTPVAVTAAPVPPPAPTAHGEPATQPAGDVARGRELVLKLECNRCHDGTGHPAMATERHCTHCHEDIANGRFGAGSPKLGAWQKSVAPYRYAPSLEGAGRRFRREWLQAFVRDPFDLRPNLAATMPRLAITAEQAADIAAYLTRDGTPTAGDDVDQGRALSGRALLESKGCGGCHAFTGVPALPTTPNATLGSDAQRKGVRLAPDLRFTRDRFRRDALVAWLLSPASIKRDTPMPTHGLSRDEARDLAAYIVQAELTAPAPRSAPARLPLLARRVTYEEVERHVLSVTCRHCHGDPDVAGGDGGPGNTGGFGFEPRGLDLSTYRSAAAGLTGSDHQRHSLFELDASGTPLLVAALLARQSEEAGRPVPGMRGMPLGLPAVSIEDVQLVDTWIAEGRPR